jgi:drug/metabolite transporter (DMT)-like permease
VKKIHSSGYAKIALTAALATASEMMLKRGALDTADLPQRLDWLGTAALHSGWVWLGMALQVLGFVSYSAALRTLPLYIAFNLMSVLHISIPLCAWIFFAEHISPARWAGIGLVLAGIWVIARPASKVEERERA